MILTESKPEVRLIFSCSMTLTDSNGLKLPGLVRTQVGFEQIMKRFLILFLALFACATLPAADVRVTGVAATNYFPYWRNGFSVTTNSALIQVSGYVGDNTLTPLTRFHVVESQTVTPRGILSAQHNTGADGARLGFRKSRGTETTPLIIVTGDELGSLQAWGYDGANYLNMSGIDFTSSGTIAATRIPTEMRFYTATDALPSVKTLRLTIANNGISTFATSVFIANPGSLTLGSAGSVNFTSRGVLEFNADGIATMRSGGGAAFSILQLGGDSATTVPATVRGGAGSGTDKVGGNLTIQGGASTGTGKGGDLSFQTSLSSTTGSTANSMQTRRFVSAKPTTLVELAATAIANLAFPTNGCIGVEVFATTRAIDASFDIQSRTDRIQFSAVNKAGTMTLSAVTTTTSTIGASTGTLVATWTVAQSGNTINILNNSSSSLTQTTLDCTWQVDINATTAVVVTPQ